MGVLPKHEDVKHEGANRRFTFHVLHAFANVHPGAGRRDRLGADVDLAALELDLAVLEGEDRVILAQADVEAGLETSCRAGGR